ncbi:hypothetical protein [Microbacterium tumbae]
MHSIDSAQAFTAPQDFCWYGAYRSVLDAIGALEEAGTALLSLSADTGWHADGMRSLKEAVDAIGVCCGTEATGLRSRLWELEAARE